MVETLKSVGPDAVTLSVAALCVLVRLIQGHRIKQPPGVNGCVLALLNGAAIFPFVLIIGSAYSPELLEVAISSKYSVSLAGAIGFLFVVGETISPHSMKDKGLAMQTSLTSSPREPAPRDTPIVHPAPGVKPDLE